jgi:hypothetical protein
MMRWTKHWLISEVARLLGPMILVYTALTVFVFRNVIPHFISALVGPPAAISQLPVLRRPKTL